MQSRVTDGRAKEGKECPVCGGPVPPSRGRRLRVYCEAACAYRAAYCRRESVKNRQCKDCGSLILPSKGRRNPARERCGDCRRAAGTHVCARCGVTFVKNGKRKYCSSQCRRRPPVHVACQECNAQFKARHEQQRFCGGACSQAANAKRLRKQNKARARPALSCLCCNKSFYKRSSGRNTGKYCSRECAFEARRLRLPCTRLGRRKGTTLSSHLAVWFHNWGNDTADPVEQGSRVGGHKARCRRFGCHYESFPDWTIFERDGWMCRLCGVALLPEWTNITGTTTPDPRSPEIDHIIPLSLGADSPGHTPSNVQACCRKCNSKKGARLLCTG